MAAASSSSSLQHTVTVFLVISLFLSVTPHARESHFFSKVTKDDEIPPTFDQKQQTNTNNEPTFVPETSDGHSYGLYGHESGQSSPGASDQTHAYKTTVFSDSATDSDSNSNSDSDSNSNSLAGTHKYSNDLPYGESLYSNNQEQNTYEQQYKDSYLTEEERARRSGVTYTTTSSDDDDITNQMEKSYNNGKKQQGLSDTRFMEGGKYFYDVNNEEPTYTRYLFN